MTDSIIFDFGLSHKDGRYFTTHWKMRIPCVMYSRNLKIRKEKIIRNKRTWLMPLKQSFKNELEMKITFTQ